MSEKVIYELGLDSTGFTNGIKQADGSVDALEEKLGHLAGIISAAFSFEKIIELGNEILHITAEMQGFDNVIKYSSINTADATANLNYLTDAVHRLHLPLVEATKSFAEVEAGFYGTGIEGQKLRNVFEGISEASTALHLSSESFSHVTFALKEIGELGTVQSRQMRMLAFALPGAMNLAAQSMHMTTARFHEEMKSGQISSSVFLQNFAAQLKEHFSGALENAGKSLQANMNDTKTTFDELKIHIGTTLEPVFISIMNNLRELAATLGGVFDWVIKNKDGFAILGSALLTLGKFYVAYRGILVGIIAVEKLQVAWQAIQLASINVLGDAFLEANAATRLLAGGFDTLMVAIESNPIGAIVIGIGLIAAAFSGLSTKIDLATKSNDSFMVSIHKDMDYSTDAATKDIENIYQRYETGVRGFDKKGKSIGYGLAEQNGLIAKGIQDQVKLFEEAHTTTLPNGQGTVMNLSYGDQQYLKMMKDYKNVHKNPDGKLTPTINTGDTAIDAKTHATASKSVNITVKIGNLVGVQNCNMVNSAASMKKMGDDVTRVLVSAVRDSEVIAGE